MTTAMEKLAELRDRRKAVESEIKEASKKLFGEVSAEIFEKHPVLVSFGWRQYTPYFNDGDECVFSANTEYVSLRTSDTPVEERDEDDEEDGDDFSNSDLYDYSNGYENKVAKDPLTPRESAGKAVLELLGGFEDKDYKDMFGDHMKITVSRTGVETEEYDHD